MSFPPLKPSYGFPLSRGKIQSSHSHQKSLHEPGLLPSPHLNPPPAPVLRFSQPCSLCPASGPGFSLCVKQTFLPNPTKPFPLPGFLPTPTFSKMSPRPQTKAGAPVTPVPVCSRSLQCTSNRCYVHLLVTQPLSLPLDQQLSEGAKHVCSVYRRTCSSWNKD